MQILSAGDTKGFPAHAGMNPAAQRAKIIYDWFPRPRGDEPVVVTRRALPASVSPPTRG